MAKWIGVVLLVWAGGVKAQMPLWVDPWARSLKPTWRLQLWEQAESIRVAHERTFNGRWTVNCEAMQAGTYFRTGVRAGPHVKLSSSVELNALAGFQFHRWITPGGVKRNVRPQFALAMRASLDEQHTLEVGFLASTLGKMPWIQSRNPIGVCGLWESRRPAFSSEARVFWSAEGSAVQWDAWWPVRTEFALGVQWRAVSGFIGLQVRCDSPHGEVRLCMLQPLQWQGAVWCLHWRPTA